MYVYNTNADCNVSNYEQVKSTGNPVWRVCAQNWGSAASKSDLKIQGFPSLLYLSIERVE